MFDAVVIGGGLAGCLAAMTLAGHHHRVLLLEAGSYPRPKVCGEFLSPECLTLLGETGFLPTLESLHPVRINEVRVTAPNGTFWGYQLPKPAVGISRFALDDALFRHAQKLGVSVHDNARVTSIEGDLHAGFTLTVRMMDGSLCTYQARSVLGAYGKHGNLDRALQRQIPPRFHPYVGLKRHFTGPPLPQRVDLHVFRGGYCGMSHVEGGVTNVCLLVSQTVFREATQSHDGSIGQFIDWMTQQNRYLRDWMAEACPVYDKWLSIGQVSLSPKTPVEGDLLLAGDSTGMIAPLAGDGMAMALHGGKLAAQLLDDYLTQRLSAQGMKEGYTRLWRQTFSTRMRLGRVLQSIMLRPILLTAGLHLLNTVPPLGNFIVTQTRDLGLTES